MSRPVAIAKGLSLPFFCVFDGDANRCGDESVKAQHERDNSCLMNLCGQAADPIPEEVVWGNNVVVWQNQIMGSVESDVGEDVWKGAEDTAREQHGLIDGVRRKNPLLIAATLEVLHASGTTSGTLQELCERILGFATSRQAN